MPGELDHRQVEGDETADEPILRLPTGEHRIRQLEAKKAEYEERLAEQEAREPFAPRDLAQSPDTRMKLAIVSRLLEAGEVPTWAFSIEFASQNEGLVVLLGPEGFEAQWNNAACVIEDYCITRGAEVTGGTGLPEFE